MPASASPTSTRERVESAEPATAPALLTALDLPDDELEALTGQTPTGTSPRRVIRCITRRWSP